MSRWLDIMLSVLGGVVFLGALGWFLIRTLKRTEDRVASASVRKSKIEEARGARRVWEIYHDGGRRVPMDRSELSGWRQAEERGGGGPARFNRTGGWRVIWGSSTAARLWGST
jgi:hypothetical protein